MPRNPEDRCKMVLSERRKKVDDAQSNISGGCTYIVPASSGTPLRIEPRIHETPDDQEFSAWQKYPARLVKEKAGRGWRAESVSLWPNGNHHVNCRSPQPGGMCVQLEIVLRILLPVACHRSHRPKGPPSPAQRTSVRVSQEDAS